MVASSVGFFFFPPPPTNLGDRAWRNLRGVSGTLEALMTEWVGHDGPAWELVRCSAGSSRATSGGLPTIGIGGSRSAPLCNEPDAVVVGREIDECGARLIAHDEGDLGALRARRATMTGLQRRQVAALEATRARMVPLSTGTTHSSNQLAVAPTHRVSPDAGVSGGQGPE